MLKNISDKSLIECHSTSHMFSFKYLLSLTPESGIEKMPDYDFMI